jgi:hypothetical protein
LVRKVPVCTSLDFKLVGAPQIVSDMK